MQNKTRICTAADNGITFWYKAVLSLDLVQIEDSVSVAWLVPNSLASAIQFSPVHPSIHSPVHPLKAIRLLEPIPAVFRWKQVTPWTTIKLLFHFFYTLVFTEKLYYMFMACFALLCLTCRIILLSGVLIYRFFKWETYMHACDFKKKNATHGNF